MKQSSEFAVLMCLSDGTGPTLKGTAASAKALQLANFHSRPHLKQFLDFFFDRGFSPKNPTTKFTRAWMEFGGPMKGFHKRSSGHTNSATGIIIIIIVIIIIIIIIRIIIIRIRVRVRFECIP